MRLNREEQELMARELGQFAGQLSVKYIVPLPRVFSEIARQAATTRMEAFTVKGKLRKKFSK